jgi:hypothetical protein
MTDGGVFEAGQGEPSLPFRPRGAYIGHQVFGDGDSAVLIDPEVARDLRLAAESARQERRIAAGLLYGRGWTDDEGDYLVVDGFLEAGPGENPHDREGNPDFTLSEPDLRLLRQDAERMYSAAVEVGWWRSQVAGGGFDPADFRTQAELVPPGGVGLLVYEAGPAWGAAYLDPDGHAPSTAGRLAAVPEPAAEPPPGPAPEPEPVGAALPASPVSTSPVPTSPLPTSPGPASGAGTGAAPARWPGSPTLTPPPQPTGPRVLSPVRVPSRELGVGTPNPSPVGPRTPTDVKIVVGALVVAAIIAAIMIGVLFSNALIAIIVAVIGLGALLGFVAMSRL